MRRLSHAFHLTKKSKQFQSTFHAGVSSDFYLFNYLDSVRNFDPSSSNFNTWHVRWNNKSTAWLIQPFFQWNHWFQNLDVQVGIHTQYFSLSNSISYSEPRVALKYYLGERQNFHLGFGLHSQMQTPYLYFFRRAGEGDNNAFLNKRMDFTRSRHFVLGYERFFGEEKVKWRLKTEVYHQYLYDVPVDSLPTSFSLLNSGATFTRIYKESFINKGKGENYGVEMTIDKTFSNGYLFLLTSSLFQSTYCGSDGIWRDTEFNGRYIVNSLFTKEWTTRKSNIVSLGMRQSLAGGRRYGYINTSASNGLQEVVFKDYGFNTLQFRPYLRADIRFSYKWNYSKSVTHELAIDFINFLNIKNVLKMIYVPDKIQDNNPQFVEEYQLGPLPFFYYRWSF